MTAHTHAALTAAACELAALLCLLAAAITHCVEHRRQL